MIGDGHPPLPPSDMERVRAPGVRAVQRAPAGETVIEELGSTVTGPIPGARLMRAAAVLATVFVVWWVAGSLDDRRSEPVLFPLGPRTEMLGGGRPGELECLDGWGWFIRCPD